MEPLLTEDPPPGNNNSAGYVKFVRSPESLELISDPNAFALLAFIAYRARWREGLGVNDVQLGEALIGDFRSLGMTRGEHREATKRLHKYHLATFRTTNRGTYAKLANSKVFDINGTAPQGLNNQPSNTPTTNEQHADAERTPSEQPLTKKGRRKAGEEGKQENLLARACGGDPPEGTIQAIYELYPKHEDPSDARKAIRAALLRLMKEERALWQSDFNNPAQFVLDRVGHYSRSRIGDPDHPKYTPSCAAWFNKRKYENDPATWERRSSSNGTRNGQFPEDFTKTIKPMTVGGSREIGSCL